MTPSDLEALKTEAVAAAKASDEARTTAWSLEARSKELASAYVIAACPFKTGDLIEGAISLTLNRHRHEREVPGRVAVTGVQLGWLDSHCMIDGGDDARAQVWAQRVAKSSGELRPGVLEITYAGKVVGHYAPPEPKP